MIGRQLAHYRITAKLGEGGMGEVFRATDTKLDREVALKILPEATSSRPERLNRFTQEAKIVAGLNHPNIVTLYSVDQADGLHYLTMELVEGDSLDRILPPTGFGIERLLDVAISVADALACAHARGIVHRDLKPANVMITDEGRMKVLDFGLAKLTFPELDDLSSDAADLPTRTREGVVVGTPYYMAPEQARGEPVDHRADLFSFGVMLFELTTGRRPFEGGSSIELLSSMLRDDPPSISGLRPGLPSGLEGIVLRCLAKDPDERYATAAELLDDLNALKQQVVSGSFPVASPPAKRRRSWRFTPMLVGALALVALVVVLAVLRPTARDATPGADAGRPVVAVLPFENLGSPGEEYFADGITDEITSRLSRIGGLGVISRTSARVYKDTEKTLREIGNELTADFVLEGTIRWDRSADPGRVRITPRLIRVSDDTHLWSDNYEREVTEVFAVQEDIATRIADALGVTLVANEREALAARPTDNIDAYQAYLQGTTQLRAPGFSRESFELGVRMFARATQLDADFALAYARLASMHARMVHYGYDRSDERLAQARAAADRALELDPDLPEAFLALGHYYYWGTRDYARALDALERGRAIAPNNSELWLATAYVKRRQGEFEDAIELLERDYELSPLDPNAAVGLGETYGVLRRYAEGERALERGIALAPNDPYPYTELALLYLRWRGDAAAARATLVEMPPLENSEACRVGFLVELFDRHYDAALSRLDGCPSEVLEAGAFFVPVTLYRGMTLRLMQQNDRASDAFEVSRKLLEARLAANPEDSRLHAALGLAYAGLGKAEDAARHGRRAVELYPLSRDALEAPVPMIQLALTYTMIDEPAAAIEQLNEVLSIPSILSAAWLEGDPRWDPLRDEADFAALLE